MQHGGYEGLFSVAHSGDQQPPMVAVLGQQYCAPDVVGMTITKRVMSFRAGEFEVTDADGGVLLQVKGNLCSFVPRRRILDAAGRPILTMQQKVFSWHSRWQVFRGDSTAASELLFSVKMKRAMLQFKTELDVFMAGNTVEQTCDFRVRGDYLERDCVIYLGNTDTAIAQMSRRYTVGNVLLGKDTFRVTVYPNVDYAFIAALVVAVDEIYNGDGS